MHRSGWPAAKPGVRNRKRQAKERQTTKASKKQSQRKSKNENASKSKSRARAQASKNKNALQAPFFLGWRADDIAPRVALCPTHKSTSKAGEMRDH